MKAALLPAYDAELSLEDVPPPEVQGASDVIVRIGGAGLCRTDLHIIEGIWKEKVDVELPYILGHENAGWVEDVGPGVRSVKPGDAVIVHPVITCGLCRACRAGEDMHCIDLAFPGITQNGGFAEYLRTGERAIIKLPEGLEPKAIAPYADAGITAYRAARRAAERLTPGTQHRADRRRRPRATSPCRCSASCAPPRSSRSTARPPRSSWRPARRAPLCERLGRSTRWRRSRS